MTLSVEDLAAYVGASAAESTLPAVLAEAIQLVSGHLGSTGRETCPTVVVDLAVKTLGAELWSRRNAVGGILSWGPDGAPVRLARDPLVSVRSMLQPYRGLGQVG